MPAFPQNGRHENQPPDHDETQAIRATLAGNRQAFALLVEKHQRPLYAMLRRLVRQHEEADDLLQESFVRAFQHLPEFDQSRAFYPWLYRIALNLALSSLRRSKRQPQHADLDRFSTNEEDPTARVADDEFHLALEQALIKLPEEQRTILLLRTREDMSYQELSETLGVEIGTVMSRLARAREKLRKWMKPYLEVARK